jgi:alpha-glucosidase
MTPTPPWTHTVHHDSSIYYLRESDSGAKLLRLRTGLDAPIEQIFIRTAPDGEQKMTPMSLVASDETCHWWEGELHEAMPRTHYRFFLMTPQGGWWLTAAGVVRHTPPDGTDFQWIANFPAPEWVRDGVFYQIFPDRFADGDPSNNVKDGEYLAYGRPVVARTWGEAPNPKQGGIEFFGGDLQGIIEKLPYLQELGVTALYLNPIFTAPSNHKYDVADYESVDPHLGGDEALVALREALDERGMHLILDIVPNHCGSTHYWFREAQAYRNAPTAEFFTFHGGDDYEKWLGVPSLPKLNYRSEKLREVMYAGENSIMRKWLRPPYRIDGWRLDVANMMARQGDSQLGHKVGRGLRRALKGEFPNSFILGENFYDGSAHLQGEELDANMNYRGFTFPVLQWLAGWEFAAQSSNPWSDNHPLPTDALANQWQAFRATIPWQIALQQFNLLGSHDTARVLSVVGENQPLAQVAATLLFTYPGVPSVYYGDEIGLTGTGDPSVRGCMPWEPSEWNHDLRSFYQTLIQLRRTAPALRWGGFQLLHAEGETVAFLREAPEEKIVVVARRAEDGLTELAVSHGGIADGTRFRDELSGAEVTVENGVLSLQGLPPTGAQIWRSPLN